MSLIDWALISEVTLSLCKGFLVTFALFALTLVFSLPLGLVISFGSMSKIKVIRYPVRWFVWVIRGVPLMLQLFNDILDPQYVLEYLSNDEDSKEARRLEKELRKLNKRYSP